MRMNNNRTSVSPGLERGGGNWDGHKDELWAVDRKGDVTEEVNDGRDDNGSYYLKGCLRVSSRL